MDPQQLPSAGFSSHVQEQLNQASQQVSQSNRTSRRGRGSGRGSGRGRGARGSSSHSQRFQGQLQDPPGPLQYGSVAHRGHPHGPPLHHFGDSYRSLSASTHSNSTVNGFGDSMSPPPSDLDSYPSLGSRPAPAPPLSQPQQLPMHTYNTPTLGAPVQGHNIQRPPQSFFERTRGNVYRAGLRHPNSHRPPQYSQHRALNSGDFQRPQNQHTQLFNPVQTMYDNPQKDFRQMVMHQSDYLNYVAADALKFQISRIELEEKEIFRKELEAITRKVIAGYGRESNFDPDRVVLKCYGSLANGFGVQGSDMDLLLMFPTDNEIIGDIEVESRRMLERALLDLGYGARLLTNTRVPILRVCQKPGPELLENLRRNREKWEQEETEAANPETHTARVADLNLQEDKEHSDRQPIVPSIEEVDAAQMLFAELEDAPRDIPLPPSPQREHANLEYKGDCGIQCDINFSNFVAIHNTKLLRCYCQHDKRVREMGIFVKAWAKARDINTPYFGTLSSYGYILMVLHYLMNIANPPVIPNLQHMARDADAWAEKTDITLFDGFDVRFVSDEEKISKTMAGVRANHESLGSLLRGFFWYYGDGQGFHWTQQVISIRTKGGLLRKYQKGWTEAKRAEGNNNVRLRYLLAIEDPFEVDHNIARTVGHNGLVAIRDEFRRAWRIIQRAERSPQGWQWQKEDGQTGEDFLEPVLHRGDLLRQDQDHHRQRLRQMKQNIEANARLVKTEGEVGEQFLDQSDLTGQGTGMSENPDSSPPNRTAERPNGSDRSIRKLTQYVGNFQDKRGKPKGRLRKVKNESDGEDQEVLLENGSSHGGHQCMENSEEEPGDPTAHDFQSNQDLESSPTALRLSQQVLYTYGFDEPGNPIAWDMRLQDGRWLRWRDSKIEKGTWRGVIAPGMLELHQQCPYNPLRPPPDPSKRPPFLHEEVSPPWPMGKREPTDSTEKLMRSDDSSTVLAADSEVNWDSNTKGGRWLLRRDRMIREGTYCGVRDGKRHLSRAFPYNPTISSNELEAKNAVLRSVFRKTDSVSKRLFNSSVMPWLGELSDEVAPTRLLEKQEEFQEEQFSRISSGYGDRLHALMSDAVDTAQEPDPCFVRKQRLAFFAHKNSPTGSVHSPESADQAPSNVQTLMKGAGNIVSNQSEVGKHLAASGLTSRGAKQAKRSKKPKKRESRTTSQPLQAPQESPVPGSSSPGPEPELIDSVSRSSSSGEPKIPETLLPDVDSNLRPRHEDPNIMPIPRSLRFKFDPRQLRDLAIIKDGGNGCARSGEEYNIEDDYEWGGGGLMGWKKSSTGREAFESAVAERPGWVAGTGDEEGLLGELPGFV